MTKFSLFSILMLSLISIHGYSQAEPCTPHNMPSNDFDGKAHIQQGGQWVAHDFFVHANTTNFSLEQVTANLWTQGGIASMDIVIYQNDNDNPGAILGDTITNIIPTSQAILTTKDDGTGTMFDVQDVIMDLPNPVDIPGTGNSPVKYWIQLIAIPNVAGTPVGWELNFDQMIGSTVRFSNPQASGWMSQGALDGVFTLSGECTINEGCLIPETVLASDITTSSATINWNGSADATQYVLEYGPA